MFVETRPHIFQTRARSARQPERRGREEMVMAIEIESELNTVPFEEETGPGKSRIPPVTMRRLLKRWFIDGMGAMALGLFASLIIGLIISQIGKIPGLSFLEDFAAVLSASSPVVGAAIGVAVAYGLEAPPLVMFASAASGAFGYAAGGPVGAYAASLVGSELGRLVSKKTPVDILVTPFVTIITGCAAGALVGAPLGSFMTWLGDVINSATVLAPLPMSIAVSILVGMALTAPISSAALCIMMGISGLAAGAACAGCCAQMIGFAAMSFPENGWSGALAQGLGTSMLQFPNILRKPAIWIPPIAASAVTGPVSTLVFGMLNTDTGAGMGTAGLVGQFGAWAAMSDITPGWFLFFEIVIVQFILPAVAAVLVAWPMRRTGIIKPKDLRLPSV